MVSPGAVSSVTSLIPTRIPVYAQIKK